MPGVPDLYQGAELWDLSLVDPDNRRVVDYDARRSVFSSRVSLDDWTTGAPKLALIRRLLALRKELPEAFASNIEAVAAPDQVLAIRRGPLLVVVPLYCARSCMERSSPLPSILGDIHVSGEWRDALDPAMPRIRALDCNALFSRFPVAVLVS
jgi:(1->4)-alpha-D-glucan 1-alpha-D-glucosylmutase